MLLLRNKVDNMAYITLKYTTPEGEVVEKLIEIADFDFPGLRGDMLELVKADFADGKTSIRDIIANEKTVLYLTWNKEIWNKANNQS